MHLGDDLAVRPFLKWAGGKRWLFDSVGFRFQANYNQYFEPFLGGGASFFAACPERAVLSDANPRLIETYQRIKSDWRKVQFDLTTHQEKHCKEYYYLERDAVYLDALEPDSKGECHELCVSGLAHAGFRYGHALKRSPNMIANWFLAANHSRTLRPPFSKLRMAR